MRNLTTSGLRFLLVASLCLMPTTSLLGGMMAAVPASGVDHFDWLNASFCSARAMRFSAVPAHVRICEFNSVNYEIS
jgi:hypothetical protein